jgi:hypothetical protein
MVQLGFSLSETHRLHADVDCRRLALSMNCSLGAMP